jgi:hypothetical protein
MIDWSKIKIRKALISEVEKIADLGIKLNLHHRNIDSKYYALDKSARSLIMKFYDILCGLQSAVSFRFYRDGKRFIRGLKSTDFSAASLRKKYKVEIVFCLLL